LGAIILDYFRGAFAAATNNKKEEENSCNWVGSCKNFIRSHPLITLGDFFPLLYAQPVHELVVPKNLS
jgi:hypothetical protein